MKRRESDEGAHAEYVLTKAGLDLQPVLLALRHGGDEYRSNPAGARLTFTERETGEPIRKMRATAAEGRPLGPGELREVEGPGYAR